jgi:hypothetical protein
MSLCVGRSIATTAKETNPQLCLRLKSIYAVSKNNETLHVIQVNEVRRCGNISEVTHTN